MTKLEKALRHAVGTASPVEGSPPDRVVVRLPLREAAREAGVSEPAAYAASRVIADLGLWTVYRRNSGAGHIYYIGWRGQDGSEFIPLMHAGPVFGRIPLDGHTKPSEVRRALYAGRVIFDVTWEACKSEAGRRALPDLAEGLDRAREVIERSLRTARLKTAAWFCKLAEEADKLRLEEHCNAALTALENAEPSMAGCVSSKSLNLKAGAVDGRFFCELYTNYIKQYQRLNTHKHVLVKSNLPSTARPKGLVMRRCAPLPEGELAPLQAVINSWRNAQTLMFGTRYLQHTERVLASRCSSWLRRGMESALEVCGTDLSPFEIFRAMLAHYVCYRRLCPRLGDAHARRALPPPNWPASRDFLLTLDLMAAAYRHVAERQPPCLYNAEGAARVLEPEKLRDSATPLKGRVLSVWDQRLVQHARMHNGFDNAASAAGYDGFVAWHGHVALRVYNEYCILKGSAACREYKEKWAARGTGWALGLSDYAQAQFDYMMRAGKVSLEWLYGDKAEMRAYGRVWGESDRAAHPENYVTADELAEVRAFKWRKGADEGGGR